LPRDVLFPAPPCYEERESSARPKPLLFFFLIFRAAGAPSPLPVLIPQVSAHPSELLCFFLHDFVGLQKGLVAILRSLERAFFVSSRFSFPSPCGFSFLDLVLNRSGLSPAGLLLSSSTLLAVRAIDLFSPSATFLPPVSTRRFFSTFLMLLGCLVAGMISCSVGSSLCFPSQAGIFLCRFLKSVRLF